MRGDERLAMEADSDFRAEQGFAGNDECIDCANCRCREDCEAAGGYPDWPEDERDD